MKKKAYITPDAEPVAMEVMYLMASSVEVSDSFVDPADDEDNEQQLSLTDEEYDGEFYARSSFDQDFWTE